MNKKLTLSLLALVLVMIAILACDSANPVAPPGSVLTVTASPTRISLNQSSTITITGFKPDGNPLNPGSQVNLSTDLGTLGATTVEIDSNGRAQTTLTPDGRIGPATVTASLPVGEATATATVQIGEGDIQPSLDLVATPTRINIEQAAEVKVVARNVDGSVLAGGRVRLRTTLGVLDEESLVTDADGEAETMLRPNDPPRAGQAEVIASVGSGANTSVMVTILQAQVSLTTNPSTLDINSFENNGGSLNTADIFIQLRDEDSIPLVAGHDVELTANLGLLIEGNVSQVTLADVANASSFLVIRTGPSGTAEVTYVPGERAGTDTITALLGNSQPGMSSVTLRDAPATVTLDVTPTEFTPSTAGQDFALTVRVSNAQGEPLNNELVRFDVSNGVGFTLTPAGGPATGGSGIATATMRITAIGVQNVTEFTITAFVRDVPSEPVLITVN